MTTCFYDDDDAGYADDTAIKIAMLTIERIGIVVSSDKIREVIESDRDAANAVNGYPSDAIEFDPDDHEIFCLVVARSIVYDDDGWPCNNDSEKTALYWQVMRTTEFVDDNYIPPSSPSSISEWVAKNHDILPNKWEEMVELASDRYLIETNHSRHNKTRTLAEIAKSDPIAANNMKDAVERIIASAFGWKP